MPRIARNMLEGILCHHLVQGINRENIFEIDKLKQKYLQLLQKYYLEFDVNVVAYCIMDNHVHLLLYSDKIKNISNFMRQVNSIYAMYYNKIKERVGYVFRNRFDSVPIMNRNHMYTCIKYIHMNPVKAGIVKKEGEYKYSSYNNFLNQTGFVNQEILEFVFNSSKNYIDKFQKIPEENMDTDKVKCNVEIMLKDFLLKHKIDFNDIKYNKNYIIKFIEYLNLNNYKFSKKKIAEILKISRATLYRWLD